MSMDPLEIGNDELSLCYLSTGYVDLRLHLRTFNAALSMQLKIIIPRRLTNHEDQSASDYTIRYSLGKAIS